MDVYSRKKRSAIMAKIKSSGTKPELIAKSRLWAEGLRYARSHKGLPGKPDIVFPSLSAVVFVHGCFWHGHVCEDARLPKSNADYWREKIAKNVLRDARVTRKLRRLGWRCFHVRTCKFESDLARTVKLLKTVHR